MGIADNTPQKGYCIYAHLNPINGKVYIGISKDVKKRWAAKEEAYKHSPAIYSAFKKYGWENFEHIVMWDNLTKEEACKLEKANIFMFKFAGMSYNVADGGEGVSGVVFSEERRKAMSEARKGIKHSPELTAKNKEIRRKLQGKPVYAFDIDSKELVMSFDSISRAAETLNTTYCCIKRAASGKACTSKGYIWSFNSSININDARYKRAKYPINEIHCYDLYGNYIKTYSSTREAVNEVGGFIGAITECCNEKALTHQGYIWRKTKEPIKQEILDRIKISRGL